jgi:hypothetical protein
MIDIVCSAGRNCSWHIGMKLEWRDGARLLAPRELALAVERVHADGEELSLLRRMWPQYFPVEHCPRVVTLFGDAARTIVANLPSLG